MRDCVNFIRSRPKERNLFLAGFSLGGNVVAKYLGEEGRHSCVKGAVCVGVPFDLEVVAQNVENNLFGFYHYAIAVPYKERYAARPAPRECPRCAPLSEDRDVVRRCDHPVVWICQSKGILPPGFE